ncbi:MAG: SNF2-related protein [Pseudonocardiaceae bacterium]
MFGAKLALIVRRGLLGDDMGLGKTTQALAAIAHATSAEGQRHHVVVCPASLVDNWLNEMKIACPAIEGHVFRQPGRGQSMSGGVPVVACCCPHTSR